MLDHFTNTPTGTLWLSNYLKISFGYIACTTAYTQICALTNVVFMPYYWQTYNICSWKTLRNVRQQDWQQGNSYHTAPPSITDILSHPLTGTRGHILALRGILADLCCFKGWKTMTSPSVTHPSSRPHTVVISLWTWLHGFNPSRLLCLTLCLQFRPTTSNPKAHMTFVYWTPAISDHISPHTPKHIHICQWAT